VEPASARGETASACADRLGEDERLFIGARDSFYMATITETGWPYVQHRGGPTGFLKVLDDRTLGSPTTAATANMSAWAT
jgi:predicted pyridoxine 5'-phosphate oxidase superfamily flavin-nucleotide-binding protein